MHYKIKVILSGLLIQACFFSSSAFSDQKFAVWGFLPDLQYSDYILTATTQPERARGCANLGGLENEIDGKCYVGAYSSYLDFASASCIDPLFVQLDGSCAATNPDVIDCSSNTDTKALSVTLAMMSQATDGVFNVGGCSYVANSAMCKTDNDCLAIAVGTGQVVSEFGVECIDNCLTATDGASTETLLIFKVIADPQSYWDKIVDTVINLDDSVTDTYTTTQQAANDAWDEITYDGEYFQEISTSGSTSSQVETEVVTTQLDGSSSSTSTIVTTNSSGGSDTTTTNASDSTATNSSVPPVTIITTIVETTVRDSDGLVISRDTTSDIVAELPEDPNALDCGYADFPDCKINENGTPNGDGQNPLTDGPGGQGLTDINGILSGIPNAPNLDTMVFNLPTPSYSSCMTITMNIKGTDLIFPNSAQCLKLEEAKEMIGWLFYILTIYIMFSIAANSGTKV